MEDEYYEEQGYEISQSWQDQTQPYAHRGAMRKAEVEPLRRGWQRARPLEPITVGQYRPSKEDEKAAKASKHGKEF